MSKDEIKRAILHFPIGLFVAWVVTFNPTLCWVLGVTFLVYEIMNDWRKKDWSYKDVFGYSFGLGFGAIGVFLWT